MKFYPIYEMVRSNFRAVRIRRGIAKLYKNDPRRTTEHINAQLNEASRQEENRQNILEGI